MAETDKADKPPVEKESFTPKDFVAMAAHIESMYRVRKDSKEREHQVKVWNEIDRQIRMEPLKADSNGTNKTASWKPELELPLQAETLEVLTADARRMMSPDAGPWYAAHAAMTDDYLARVDFKSLIAGDENEVPSQVNQDNADKLVEGWQNNFRRQYDFWGNIDLINGEAFKYGVGIGRGRVVTKTIFINTAKGFTKKTIKMPVLVPRSIKNVFLDDTAHSLMNEGFFIGPSTITDKMIKWADVQIAAKRGKNDPEDEGGGWMPANLKNIKPDKNEEVTLVEYEGDLVVPKSSSGPLFIPNALVTIIINTNKPKVVRFRFRKRAFSSFIQFPYHRESIDSLYGSSPLMKGMPIQSAATLVFNDTLAVSALNAQPPIGYDNSDLVFAQAGGPEVFPGAQWETTGEVKVYEIGDPVALGGVYGDLLRQYADVTGVSASRLGAQTRSHTTAFAKEAELSRGTVRTVDYAKSTLKSPMAQWLNMEFILGKDAMGDRTDTVFIDQYGGFVEIDKEKLPDNVVYDVFGSGGPSEEQAKEAKKSNSLQQALQIEVAKRQEGLGGQKMDLDAVQKQILNNGGWTDTAQFFSDDAGGAAGFEQPPGLLTEENIGGQ